MYNIFCELLQGYKKNKCGFNPHFVTIVLTSLNQFLFLAPFALQFPSNWVALLMPRVVDFSQISYSSLLGNCRLIELHALSILPIQQIHSATVELATGTFRFAFDLFCLPFIHSSTAASLAARSLVSTGGFFS